MDIGAVRTRRRGHGSLAEPVEGFGPWTASAWKSNASSRRTQARFFGCCATRTVMWRSTAPGCSWTPLACRRLRSGTVLWFTWTERHSTTIRWGYTTSPSQSRHSSRTAKSPGRSSGRSGLRSATSTATHSSRPTVARSPRRTTTGLPLILFGRNEQSSRSSPKVRCERPWASWPVRLHGASA